MDFDKLQGGSGNVAINEYKDVYDEKEGKIYRTHTIKTDGEAGEIHSVFCAECKKEMLKGEKYYCPYCNG